MADRLRKVGVMGGTFDPIHYGHLVTAEGARGDFGLDEVVFVPTGQPAHKDPAGVTPADHRHLMTVLATLTHWRFDVSRVDIDRPGPTHTIDTIRDLRVYYGSDAELYFITGADAMLEILDWKNGGDLLRSTQFIAATRPGFELEHLQQELGPLWDTHQHHVHLLQVPALSISSSDIRQRVRDRRPIRYLLPDQVAHYIFKNDLYLSHSA